MWRIVGHIQQEGAACRSIVGNTADCFLRNQVRGIAFVVAGLFLAVPVELALALVGKVINRPVIMAIEMGKSPLQRQIRTRGVPQMPFPENGPVFVTGTRQVVT